MRPGRLRKLRRCRNWSQRELAAEAGVSQPTISAIETGDSGLTGATGVRIAGAFGLTVDELRAGVCGHCDSSPGAVFACLAWARKAAP